MDNSKNRIFVTLAVVGLLAACQAPQDSTNAAKLFAKPDRKGLTVGADANGCPLDVVSPSRTCDSGKADKPNESCHKQGAVIRWYPRGNPIKIIWEDGENPTKTCFSNANSGFYQCVLLPRLDEGAEYRYTVGVTDADDNCEIDPKIIIM